MTYIESPSHISSTIQGLSTIRAYKEQFRFLNVHHFYQNEHTKAWFIKITAIRWLGMRLDMFGTVFLTLVTFASILLADGNKLSVTLIIVAYEHVCV